MNLVFHIILIASSVLALTIVIYFLSKKKLDLKYSLTWLAATLAMTVFAVFPELVGKFGLLLGIQSEINTVFFIAGVFSLIIIFTLTIIVSHLNNKLYQVTQNQALLEKRLRELENAVKKDSAPDSNEDPQ